MGLGLARVDVLHGVGVKREEVCCERPAHLVRVRFGPRVRAQG